MIPLTEMPLITNLPPNDPVERAILLKEEEAMGQIEKLSPNARSKGELLIRQKIYAIRERANLFIRQGFAADQVLEKISRGNKGSFTALHRAVEELSSATHSYQKKKVSLQKRWSEPETDLAAVVLSDTPPFFPEQGTTLLKALSSAAHLAVPPPLPESPLPATYGDVPPLTHKQVIQLQHGLLQIASILPAATMAATAVVTEKLCTLSSETEAACALLKRGAERVVSGVKEVIPLSIQNGVSASISRLKTANRTHCQLHGIGREEATRAEEHVTEIGVGAAIFSVSRLLPRALPKKSTGAVEFAAVEEEFQLVHPGATHRLQHATQEALEVAHHIATPHPDEEESDSTQPAHRAKKEER